MSISLATATKSNLMSTHTWNSHQIEVVSLAEPRHLWLTISLHVLVDGQPVGVSPDEFEGLRSTVPFDVRGIPGIVTSRRASAVIFVRYSIEMDGEHLGDGYTTTRNWYATYLVLISAGMLLLAALIAIDPLGA